MTRSHPLRPALRASLVATLVATLAATFAVACDSTSDIPTEPVPRGAVVTFAFDGHPADTLRVPVEDAATIAAAESYVRTKAGPHLLIGKITRGASLDARYPFRFDAATVRLADAAMEVCDGAPMRTPSALDDFFEWSTGSRASTVTTWCPWSSYPVKVERIGGS